MNKFKLGQKVKIIRIEYIKENDWNWFTVHDLEEVKEILDEKEKEYLSNVIKPFKNKIKNIEKRISYGDGLEEFIVIHVKNDYSIDLPNFKKNTMYKNMKINKQYTLEELGL